MQEAGKPSWRIVVRRWEQLIDSALWIRAAERLDVPAGGVIPGPLDIDPVPAPSTSSGPPTGPGAGVGGLVALPGGRAGPGAASRGTRSPEPAYDTPDPLGLAGRPALRAVVARRWPEMRDWQAERTRAGMTRAPAADRCWTCGSCRTSSGRPAGRRGRSTWS